MNKPCNTLDNNPQGQYYLLRQCNWQLIQNVDLIHQAADNTMPLYNFAEDSWEGENKSFIFSYTEGQISHYLATLKDSLLNSMEAPMQTQITRKLALNI